MDSVEKALRRLAKEPGPAGQIAALGLYQSIWPKLVNPLWDIIEPVPGVTYDYLRDLSREYHGFVLSCYRGKRGRLK